MWFFELILIAVIFGWVFGTASIFLTIYIIERSERKNGKKTRDSHRPIE